MEFMPTCPVEMPPGPPLSSRSLLSLIIWPLYYCLILYYWLYVEPWVLILDVVWLFEPLCALTPEIWLLRPPLSWPLFMLAFLFEFYYYFPLLYESLDKDRWSKTRFYCFWGALINDLLFWYWFVLWPRYYPDGGPLYPICYLKSVVI